MLPLRGRARSHRLCHVEIRHRAGNAGVFIKADHIAHRTGLLVGFAAPVIGVGARSIDHVRDMLQCLLIIIVAIDAFTTLDNRDAHIVAPRIKRLAFADVTRDMHYALLCRHYLRLFHE